MATDQCALIFVFVASAGAGASPACFLNVHSSSWIFILDLESGHTDALLCTYINWGVVKAAEHVASAHCRCRLQCSWLDFLAVVGSGIQNPATAARWRHRFQCVRSHVCTYASQSCFARCRGPFLNATACHRRFMTHCVRNLLMNTNIQVRVKVV